MKLLFEGTTLQRAEAALEAGDYLAATHFAEGALTEGADTAAALELSCMAHYRLGNFAIAQQRAEEGIALNPAGVAVTFHLVLGYALYFQDEGDQAEAAFRHFVESMPSHWQSHLTLAWLYYRNNWIDRARTCCETAYGLAPQQPDVLRELARCEVVANPARAERLLREGLSRRPFDSDALNLLGCALHNQRKYVRAMSAYTAALRADPRNLEAQGNIHLLMSTRWAAGALAWLGVMCAVVVLRDIDFAHFSWGRLRGLALTLGGLVTIYCAYWLAVRTAAWWADPQLLKIYRKLRAEVPDVKADDDFVNRYYRVRAVQRSL